MTVKECPILAPSCWKSIITCSSGFHDETNSCISLSVSLVRYASRSLIKYTNCWKPHIVEISNVSGFCSASWFSAVSLALAFAHEIRPATAFSNSSLFMTVVFFYVTMVLDSCSEMKRVSELPFPKINEKAENKHAIYLTFFNFAMFALSQ